MAPNRKQCQSFWPGMRAEREGTVRRRKRRRREFFVSAVTVSGCEGMRSCWCPATIALSCTLMWWEQNVKLCIGQGFRKLHFTATERWNRCIEFVTSTQKKICFQRKTIFQFVYDLSKWIEIRFIPNRVRIKQEMRVRDYRNIWNLKCLALDVKKWIFL